MKNHILLIMRHAKAERAGGTFADFDRTLTRRGIRDAVRMGAWLGGRDMVPDCVVSSPAERTKQQR
jgi:Phosphohistidine phosphatase SixA